MKCKNCNNKLDSESDIWLCEICGKEHCYNCSGYYTEGTGEYPHEDELSLCKECEEKEE